MMSTCVIRPKVEVVIKGLSMPRINHRGRKHSMADSPLRMFFLTMAVACLASLRISPQLLTSSSEAGDAMLPFPTNHQEAAAATVTFTNVSDSSTILYNVSNIPKFMMEYFEWHTDQLYQLQKGELSWTPSESSSSSNASSTADISTTPRFLILRCIDGDRCGGTSDRLKAFPLFLLLAKQSNRILLIRWGRHRPFPISEFLQPGPLWKWTVPQPLLALLEEGDGLGKESGDVATISSTAVLNEIGNEHSNIHSRHRREYYDGTKFKQLRKSAMDSSVWLVEGNDFSGGASRYNELVKQSLSQQSEDSGWRIDDSDYLNFYHDLFHASFRPSPAVERILESYLDFGRSDELPRKDSSLPVLMKPNNYMVSHYRAKYPGEAYRETWNVSILEETAIYAVECARNRNPSHQSVYFASDTALAIQAVYTEYSIKRQKQQGPRRNQNGSHVWSYLNLAEHQSAARNDQDSVTAPFAADPPHLNFAKLEDPSGFYGIFVDLFLMSYSTCVVYGAGGFGRFGSLVSFHPKCGVPFTKQGGALQQCQPYGDNLI